MKQLELFAPSRLRDGLYALRRELEIVDEINGYRCELRQLGEIVDDPEYVRDQTNNLIHLIQLCHDQLALIRRQRQLI